MDLKNLLPHLASVLVIILAVFVYCSPVLKGKTLVQSDIVKHKALSKEVVEYRENGEEILWTSRVFSGMTTFNISTMYYTNVMSTVKYLMQLFPSGVNIIIFTCLGFYLLLIIMGLNPWLALVASIAYGISSNLLSSLGAGHNTKILTIAYMAPAIGGVALAFRGKLLIGAFLTALFVGLMITAGHYQIIYYFMLTCLIAGVVFLIYAIKEKTLKNYAKTVGLLVLAGVLGFLPNFSKVYNTYDHSKETIRGGKKLLSTQDKKDEGGLDRSYAMSWSQGIMESFSIVVPTIKGGSSQERLADDGEVSKLVGGPKKNQPLIAPTYIGDQPFLQGVVYFGAAFVFLFILSLFAVDNKIKVWLISVIVLSFFIAWGRHFSIFTNLLFDYFPLYNKFRTPSMALCMAGLAIPLLGMLGLSNIFDASFDKIRFSKAFKASIYTAGGLMVFLLLYGLMNDWTGPKDAELTSRAPWNNDDLYNALLADRKSLFLSDWMLSTFFMAMTAASIWFYKRGKLNIAVIAVVLAVVGVGDMWRVSKRYLNDDSFIAEKKYKNQYTASAADAVILRDTHPHYRVVNLTRNPWTDGMSSYHHENIGGHHAAKIQRYQDLIESHLSSQVGIINKAIVQGSNGLSMNPQVSSQMTAYNMLNTKYYIVQESAQGVVQNPTACGNAWFVSTIKQVASHDEEMASIAAFDPNETAIVHEEFSADVYNYSFGKSSDASIELSAFKPNHLQYRSINSQDGLAVFSEVYYSNGWNAYIDGEPTEIIRVNYILRAIKVPAGSHSIEMKFEPSSYAIGERVSLAGSALFVLFAGGMLFLYFKKREE